MNFPWALCLDPCCVALGVAGGRGGGEGTVLGVLLNGTEGIHNTYGHVSTETNNVQTLTCIHKYA